MKRKRKDMGDAKMLRSEEVKRPFIIMHSDDSPHWEGAMIADWAAESILACVVQQAVDAGGRQSREEESVKERCRESVRK
jgi:hypothetical protein